MRVKRGGLAAVEARPLCRSRASQDKSRKTRNQARGAAPLALPRLAALAVEPEDVYEPWA